MNPDEISSVNSNLMESDNLASLKSNSEGFKDDENRLDEREEGEVEDEDSQNLIVDEEDRLLLAKMDAKEREAVFKQRVEKRKALKAQLIKEKHRKNGTKNEKQARSRSTSRDNTGSTSKVVIEKLDERQDKQKEMKLRKSSSSASSSSSSSSSDDDKKVKKSKKCSFSSSSSSSASSSERQHSRDKRNRSYSRSKSRSSSRSISRTRSRTRSRSHSRSRSRSSPSRNYKGIIIKDYRRGRRGGFSSYGRYIRGRRPYRRGAYIPYHSYSRRRDYSRSRSRTRSRSRSRSKTRSRTKSRSRSRERSLSKAKSKSFSKSPNRSPRRISDKSMNSSKIESKIEILNPADIKKTQKQAAQSFLAMLEEKQKKSRMILLDSSKADKSDFDSQPQHGFVNTFNTVGTPDSQSKHTLSFDLENDGWQVIDDAEGDMVKNEDGDEIESQKETKVKPRTKSEVNKVIIDSIANSVSKSKVNKKPKNEVSEAEESLSRKDLDSKKKSKKRKKEKRKKKRSSSSSSEDDKKRKRKKRKVSEESSCDSDDSEKQESLEDKKEAKSEESNRKNVDQESFSVKKKDKSKKKKSNKDESSSNSDSDEKSKRKKKKEKKKPKKKKSKKRKKDVSSSDESDSSDSDFQKKKKSKRKSKKKKKDKKKHKKEKGTKVKKSDDKKKSFHEPDLDYLEIDNNEAGPSGIELKWPSSLIKQTKTKPSLQYCINPSVLNDLSDSDCLVNPLVSEYERFLDEVNPSFSNSIEASYNNLIKSENESLYSNVDKIYSSEVQADVLTPSEKRALEKLKKQQQNELEKEGAIKLQEELNTGPLSTYYSSKKANQDASPNMNNSGPIKQESAGFNQFELVNKSGKCDEISISLSDNRVKKEKVEDEKLEDSEDSRKLTARQLLEKIRKKKENDKSSQNKSVATKFPVIGKIKKPKKKTSSEDETSNSSNTAEGVKKDEPGYIMNVDYQWYVPNFMNAYGLDAYSASYYAQYLMVTGGKYQTPDMTAWFQQRGYNMVNHEVPPPPLVEPKSELTVSESIDTVDNPIQTSQEANNTDNMDGVAMDVETSESLINSEIETNKNTESSENTETTSEDNKTKTGNSLGEINEIEVIVPSTPLSANEMLINHIDFPTRVNPFIDCEQTHRDEMSSPPPPPPPPCRPKMTEIVSNTTTILPNGIKLPPGTRQIIVHPYLSSHPFSNHFNTESINRGFNDIACGENLNLNSSTITAHVHS